MDHMTPPPQSPSHTPDFGALVGYEIETPEPGIAVLKLPLQAHHRNRLGTVHGGVIMTILDAAGMWACNRAGEAPGCPTVSLSCSFLKVVVPSEHGTLLARAELVRKGRRLYFVNIEALAGEDLVATAQAIYAVRQTQGQ
jgi:uncharacterized protein (TIGR00369 family)